MVDLFAADAGAAHNCAAPDLFFVHGGGWHAGGRAVYHEIIREFCREGFRCASTDYRLEPGSIFHQIEDVRESLRLFLAARHPADPDNGVVLAGCSAGAHLALIAALTPGDGDPQYREQIVGVAVQAAPVSFEPWEDMFPQIWQSMQAAAGCRYAEDPQRFRSLSPNRHIHRGMPSILFLHAEHEHMFPLGLLQDFSVRAAEVGATAEILHYPKTEHGFFHALDRWQQRKAREDIRDFALRVAAAQRNATALP